MSEDFVAYWDREWTTPPMEPPSRWHCDQCGREIPEGVYGCYNPWTGDDDCDGKPVDENGNTPWDSPTTQPKRETR